VNPISLLSSIAMAVGLAASLPQILRMVKTRSSGGQSVLGWGMGLITNLSMAYVNLFGFGAAELMVSNLISGGLCVVAMLLIVRFNGEPIVADDLAQTTLIELRPALHIAGAQAPAGRPVAPNRVLADMPTTEFVALRDAVHAADAHRAERADGASEDRQLAYAA